MERTDILCLTNRHLHTLSPLTFSTADKGARFVLCSINGAACTWIASKVPALLIGSFLNATAVADIANGLRKEKHANITVIPCGEKWSDVKDNENSLRPGLEDYLGAGMILSKLTGSKSPEAQVCIGAYEYSSTNIKELINDCGSGRELRERGYELDVEYCSQIDKSKAVPVLSDNYFKNASNGA
jgi:2-phosphosulfolactate phosphatase